MNGEAPPQPVEHLAKRLLDEMESMARRDPAKAVMSAVGLGIALNALPTRAIVAGVTAVTVTLLRPVLLTLGVVKLLELARTQTLRIP
jgi:hypothetical protein